MHFCKYSDEFRNSNCVSLLSVEYAVEKFSKAFVSQVKSENLVESSSVLRDLRTVAIFSMALQAHRLSTTLTG